MAGIAAASNRPPPDLWACPLRGSSAPYHIANGLRGQLRLQFLKTARLRQQVSGVPTDRGRSKGASAAWKGNGVPFAALRRGCSRAGPATRQPTEMSRCSARALQQDLSRPLPDPRAVDVRGRDDVRPFGSPKRNSTPARVGKLAKGKVGEDSISRSPFVGDSFLLTNGCYRRIAAWGNNC